MCNTSVSSVVSRCKVFSVQRQRSVLLYVPWEGLCFSHLVHTASTPTHYKSLTTQHHTLMTRVYTTLNKPSQKINQKNLGFHMKYITLINITINGVTYLFFFTYTPHVTSRLGQRNAADHQ